MNGTSEARASANDSRYAQAAGWYLRIREAETEGPELSAEEMLEWHQFFARPENREAVDLAIGVSWGFSHQRGRTGTAPELMQTVDEGCLFTLRKRLLQNNEVGAAVHRRTHRVTQAASLR